MEDEMEEGEPMIYAPAPPSSSPLENGPIFQLIRWVNTSSNLIWLYLKCCPRLISCSHGCDHVCEVVAWRFCCGTDEFTSPIDFFVLRTWILEFFGGVRRMTVPLVILLSWSEMGVCVCLKFELEFICSDLISSGCRMFRRFCYSCIWTYAFGMYFIKETVNYNINKCSVA
jgi:hypothetical protein